MFFGDYFEKLGLVGKIVWSVLFFVGGTIVGAIPIIGAYFLLMILISGHDGSSLDWGMFFGVVFGVFLQCAVINCWWPMQHFCMGY